MMATAEPVMKPRRRPTFAIHSAAGIAATAEPSTKVVTPAVASALFAASAYPTRPFIAINAELLTSSNA